VDINTRPATRSLGLIQITANVLSNSHWQISAACSLSIGFNCSRTYCSTTKIAVHVPCRILYLAASRAGSEAGRLPATVIHVDSNDWATPHCSYKMSVDRRCINSNSTVSCQTNISSDIATIACSIIFAVTTSSYWLAKSTKG